MRAMLIPVGEMPYEIDINGYEDLKEAVEGSIDACGWIFDDEPAIYVNDDGLYACVPNRAVYARAEDAGKPTWGGEIIEEGDLIHVIYGNFVAIGLDPSTGEDQDITDEEIEKVLDRFGTDESIESGILEATRIQMGLTKTAW